MSECETKVVLKEDVKPNESLIESDVKVKNRRRIDISESIFLLYIFLIFFRYIFEIYQSYCVSCSKCRTSSYYSICINQRSRSVFENCSCIL